MIWKCIKGAIVIVICAVSLYFIFGAVKIELSGSAVKKNNNIYVTYNVVNNSIAPLTLYREDKQQAFVDVLFYDSNKRPIKYTIDIPEPQVQKGELKTDGGDYNDPSHTIPITGKLAKAMYVKFRIRVNKNYVESSYEKNISFLRKGRVTTDYILIKDLEGK